MNIHELINFLHRVWCWMPHDNPIRNEVKQMIDRLKSQIN